MSNTGNEAADDTTQKINKAFSPINTNDRLVRQNFFVPDKSLKKHRFSPKQIALSLGFVLLVTIFGIFTMNLLTNRSTDSTSNQIKSVFSGEELKDYNSSENGFTILMPGIPEISKSSKKTGDGNKTVEITTYQRAIENNTKDYTLAVYDFREIQLDELQVLENALNSALQNTPGTEIKSTQVGKYNDHNAIEAVYTVSTKGAPYEAHIRYVIKESKMYTMILSGGDQAKFDQFANSLRLN